jgi:pyridoxal phosphate enzyme (YggS family)
MEKYNTPLKAVLTKISEALLNSKVTRLKPQVKLLAVTKRRSIEDIKKIYDEGQRNFGENYVDEIIEKFDKLPSDINWHMIGHLQTNKCKKLLNVPNLKVVESVDNFRLADELNKRCDKSNRNLEIYIQVNISKEETKSGAKVEEILDLYEEINTKCPKLKITGLMSLGTIGSVEEFQLMCQIKDQICEKFSLDKDEFLLSFGTSDDFEQAIIHGSNEVRVGSLLFE